MTDERIVGVLEARMGSSRLPGKSMMPLAGAPMVERVIERLRRAASLTDIVVATSDRPRDDVLADHVRAIGVPVFRGSEDDVLGRILAAARSRQATVHVQCWGDCPFLDPTEVDRTVLALLANQVDLAGNGLAAERTLPYGLDVIALRVRALEEAERETRESPYHREHGTTFIYQTPSRFKTLELDTPAALRIPNFDATINTEADYRFVAAVYTALYDDSPEFAIADVIAVVNERPALQLHPKGAALVGRWPI